MFGRLDVLKFGSQEARKSRKSGCLEVRRFMVEGHKLIHESDKPS